MTRLFHFTERTLATDDGAILEVTTFEPLAPVRATTLLLPGIGVPRRALRHLGAWLAEHEVRAWSLDYRGMGSSRPGSRAPSLSAWAADAAAAFRSIEGEHGTSPVVIGHSFGGHALGLADDFKRAPAIVLAGSALGDWRLWRGRRRALIAGYWYALLPLAASLLDPLPSWLGVGNVPAGVAREWARWGRTDGYFLPHVPEARARYAQLTMPLRAYTFTDDDLAPPRAASALLELLPRERLEHREVAPGDLGLSSLGHFGIFSRELALPLWNEILTFVLAHGSRPRQRGLA